MWGEECIAITDKGFSSEEDFAKLLELRLDYVSPLKRNNRFAKDKIPGGPSGWKQAFNYNRRGICCMTLPQDGFVVHVYLDTEPCYREFSDATARLEGREDAKAAKAEAERARREQGKGRLTDEQLADLGPASITDALADRKAMGTLSVRTNRSDLSARTVYRILKQRQAVEQFFKTYDDTLGFEATWMRSDEAMEGPLFLNHLFDGSWQVVTRTTWTFSPARGSSWTPTSLEMGPLSTLRSTPNSRELQAKITACAHAPRDSAKRVCRPDDPGAVRTLSH